jgi:F0F1-type ATP synthase assembly protein I
MPDQKQPNPYIKYSSLAIQMAVTIGLAAWGGRKLDQHFHTSKPVFTIVLCLAGIVAALYLVLKDFIKPKE